MVGTNDLPIQLSIMHTLEIQMVTKFVLTQAPLKAKF